MALEIRSIPVLTGETAERFVREAETNALNPKRGSTLSFLSRNDQTISRARLLVISLDIAKAVCITNY